jgi:hypothetical protein
MNRQLLKDSLGWGLSLWFIGYVLGIILFFLLPVSTIGWVILPIGVTITFWILFNKVRADSYQYYLILAVFWTVIAVAFDYIFIIRTFNPQDGYYKLDVYSYYAITFLSPLIVAWWKRNQWKIDSQPLQ